MVPAGGRIAETIKTIDKTGALAGTGTKTEVGKYRNIFENFGTGNHARLAQVMFIKKNV